MDWLYALLLGYLLGSVPFGLILTRFFGTVDLRSIGSGNIGATNVLRTGNKGLAAATLLLDAGKGAAAVLLGYWIASLIDPNGNPWAGPISGFAALVGHCYPVWLRFNGGKGVATMLGVAFVPDWRIGAASILAWIVVGLVTRISSLSGMCAAVTAPVVAFLLYLSESKGLLGSLVTAIMIPVALALSAMALIILWRHRANIARLRAGTEPKIGQKSA